MNHDCDRSCRPSFSRHPPTKLPIDRYDTQVGNPGFAIVDEAYPYISKRLLTDDSPRLREALRYMIYGKSNVFDVERLIDLLQVGGVGLGASKVFEQRQWGNRK